MQPNTFVRQLRSAEPKRLDIRKHIPLLDRPAVELDAAAIQKVLLGLVPKHHAERVIEAFNAQLPGIEALGAHISIIRSETGTRVSICIVLPTAHPKMDERLFRLVRGYGFDLTHVSIPVPGQLDRYQVDEKGVRQTDWQPEARNRTVVTEQHFECAYVIRCGNYRAKNIVTMDTIAADFVRLVRDFIAMRTSIDNGEHTTITLPAPSPVHAILQDYAETRRAAAMGR